MKEINKEEFKKEVEDYVKVLFRKKIKEADEQQLFQAVSYAVKDFIVDQWMATHRTYEEKGCQDSILSVHGVFNRSCFGKHYYQPQRKQSDSRGN